VAAKKKKVNDDRTEITFVGGSYDGRTVEFVHPCQEYLVMNLGRDLYIKETRDRYIYSTDWSLVEKFRKKEIY
jgi:hypothetical protein